MTIAPLSEVQIYDIIIDAEQKLRPVAQRFWSELKVTPQQWKEASFGKYLGGFWVVGIFGEHIIWYNEIEEGFSISKYSQYGRIDNYNSYVSTLSDIIEQIVRKLEGELKYSS